VTDSEAGFITAHQSNFAGLLLKCFTRLLAAHQ